MRRGTPVRFNLEPTWPLAGAERPRSPRGRALGRRMEYEGIRMRDLRATFLLACTVAVPPASVWAASADPSFAVAPVRVEGAGPRQAVVAERVARAASEGVARLPGATVVSLDVDEDCTTAACRLDGAKSLGARWLLDVDVTVEDRDYQVHLAVRDAEGKVPDVRESFECQICGIEELGERTAAVAAKLVEAVAAQDAGAGTVQVRTTPPGAQVAVDGTSVGTTPLRLELSPGEHRVRIEREGHAAVERTVVVPAGGEVTMDVPLIPTVQARSWRRPAGIAAVTVGGAAFVAGVVLLALDGRPYRGRCSGADVDADGDCRFQYDTIAGGATLAVAGTAAVTSGIFWLVAQKVAQGRRTRR
ncbi:MAG: PEGA domain-containing protein [Deltaproteobacteria bacterium]|nr:MAG: PEGA domain-containing protein [Deltaproteobacteria bacterium]